MNYKYWWDTISKNDKLSWVSHALIAAGLAWIFSPEVAVGYYLLRECEQVLMDKFVYKNPLHPLDHVMDVAAPATTVFILYYLL